MRLIIIILFLSFSDISESSIDLSSFAHKKMVAIGESGHGVSEYHVIRSKISLDLIKKYHYRHVFIEAPVFIGIDLNQALQGH